MVYSRRASEHIHQQRHQLQNPGKILLSETNAVSEVDDIREGTNRAN